MTIRPVCFKMGTIHSKQREIKAMARITKLHTIEDICDQMENGTAKKVVRACFRQGNEDDIRTDFYRLWGEIIRIVHNRRDTTTQFYFVKGENRDLFNAHYGS